MIPPLRERVGEIRPLAESFVRVFCAEVGRTRPPTLSREALTALQQYAWPGNIRELRNIVERAVLLCGNGGVVERSHLPIDKMGRTLPSRAPDPPLFSTRYSSSPPPPPEILGRGSSREGERERLEQALSFCGGNQTQAAKMLGISRRTLISRIEQYGLPRPRKSPPGA